jgi:two-component system chemotaxis response regulator CheB
VNASIRIKILVIDYMPLVRKVLADGFERSASIDVVATAPNVSLAKRKILTSQPSVIVLDLQPPIERDVDVLRRFLASFPIPIILFTAQGEPIQRTVMDALHIKRSHVLIKPQTGLARGLGAMLDDIASVIQDAYQENIRGGQSKRYPAITMPRILTVTADRVIAVGASTGGTEALCEILSQLPGDTPGIVIVQHMLKGFTHMFAERLNELSAMAVKEAEDGDDVCPGRVLLAPAGYQMRLVRAGQGYKVRVEPGEKVNGHCPSVDVLMTSVAKHAGARGIGIMLTGMGSDGAEGMKILRDTGATTFAQDEQTSVVFGMPKEAYQRGGAEKLVPLQDIAKHLTMSLVK